jgi:hypothetical protein
MNNLTSVVKQLQLDRSRLTSQLQNLNHAISALNGLSGNGTRRGGGKISAAGRARIAAAQRARWAKVKGQKVVPITPRRRRRMSAAARKRIVAAQKARWAKWRKAQKA